MKAKSLSAAATQMAAILSQSQVSACRGNTGRRESARFLRLCRAWLSQRLARRDHAADGTGLRSVYADTSERLTIGRRWKRRRTSSDDTATLCRWRAKETAAIFDLYSHLLSDARLRRELFAEVDKGAAAEWAVKNHRKFAEQFAALTDNYLKERVRLTHAGAAAVIPP